MSAFTTSTSIRAHEPLYSKYESQTRSMCACAFAFVPATPSASRSPCPALNTLANHGYIPRNGIAIPFWTLFGAIKHVYNLSTPLALLLTTVGYLTSGTFVLFNFKDNNSTRNPACPHTEKHPDHTNTASATSTSPSPSPLASLGRFLCALPLPSWTLDLSALSVRGPYKIAHDGSLVHPDGVTSCAPDPVLLAQVVDAAADPAEPEAGLTLAGLGRLHAARTAALEPGHALSALHEKIALGECGLAWCVMRAGAGAGAGGEMMGRRGTTSKDGIPPAVLREWFGEERLPGGWWGDCGRRPVRTVGLRDAARRAKEVGMFANVR
ncbi:hypothetical protein H0H81_008170 [Sphagnurus paluster]|uniref:Heme haloperoxidase family profile domain-containing protein n=1 Tax=Sphagnurus paluster TaxID=117069 RepID=A0A9P7FSS6_9AGAR|nr:hypothetical protein H0H81_008170 [Sphagnurus paluster]